MAISHTGCNAKCTDDMNKNFGNVKRHGNCPTVASYVCSQINCTDNMHIQFEVFEAITIHIVVFCTMTPCGLVLMLWGTLRVELSMWISMFLCKQLPQQQVCGIYVLHETTAVIWHCLGTIMKHSEFFLKCSITVYNAVLNIYNTVQYQRYDYNMRELLTK